jgi:hypothetical protein
MRKTFLVGIGFLLAAHGAERPIEVTVALHNVQYPFAATAQGEVIAEGIYSHIGIRLKFLLGGAVANDVIDIEFRTDTPSRAFPGALAYTALDPPARPHIVIFLDRVREATDGHNMAAVLGYVFAHELAHAFGVVPHGSMGIMKARWESGDFGKITLETLSFVYDEIPRIRAGAAAYAATLRPAIVTDVAAIRSDSPLLAKEK